jgi:hypothetical protein
LRWRSAAGSRSLAITPRHLSSCSWYGGISNCGGCWAGLRLLLLLLLLLLLVVVVLLLLLLSHSQD